MKQLFFLVAFIALGSSNAAAQFHAFIFTDVEYHNNKRSWITVDYDFTVKNIGKEKYEIVVTENKDPHRVVFWVKAKYSRKKQKRFEYVIYDTSINSASTYMITSKDLWKVCYGESVSLLLINKYGGEQQIRLYNYLQ